MTPSVGMVANGNSTLILHERSDRVPAKTVGTGVFLGLFAVGMVLSTPSPSEKTMFLLPASERGETSLKMLEFHCFWTQRAAYSLVSCKNALPIPAFDPPDVL